MNINELVYSIKMGVVQIRQKYKGLKEQNYTICQHPHISNDSTTHYLPTELSKRSETQTFSMLLVFIIFLFS